MGIMDTINEQIYIMFSIYYYEVFLYKGNIQVGRIVQTVSFSPAFIVDFKRKLAWVIVKDRAFIKGHKIILHYEMDLGIPLQEITEEKVKEVNSVVIKTQSITKLVADITQDQKDKSKNKMITASNLPPHMIFEIFNAHFVTKVLAEKKSTDWGMVLLALIIVIGVLGFIAIFVFGFK
jgi:hypothetical protein